MKSLLLVFLISLIIFSVSTASAVYAQESGPVKMIEAAISRNVVDRMPVGAGISFPASITKLYCYTEIATTQIPTEVTHVWYFGNVERARVTLPVKSLNWRTFSSKIIQKHEIGSWVVEVLGPDGKVLQTLRFKITP
jgi:hypothetical protein